MGNSIGSAVSHSMEQTQRNLQQEMLQKQWELQLRGQERMMRSQIAMQMAASRDLCYWMGSVLVVGVAGLSVAVVKGKRPPPVVIIPLAIYSIVLAYQVDFAFGNKAERIRKMRDEIITKEEHWFVPLTVDKVVEHKK